MQTQSLLDNTLVLLRARGRYREVAEATGLGYDWICKLVQGHIADPGVMKIELLHGFLADEAQARADLREKYGPEARGVA